MTAIHIMVRCLTPLHVGGGDSDSGIEQAIVRDRSTNHPLIPSSSLKGVLRQAARDTGITADREQLIFGGTDGLGLQRRGAVAFGDANLLLFPVRSIVGTFAWATSPALIRRWWLLHRASNSPCVSNTPPNLLHSDCALTAVKNPAVVYGAPGQKRILLEEFVLTPNYNNVAEAWAIHFADLLFPAQPNGAPNAERDFFLDRFCVLPDNVMNFLLDFATQLDPRVKLSHVKSVQHFWHEEFLPTESVLGSLCVLFDPSPEEENNIVTDLQTLVQIPLQFGGNETVGRGITRAAISRL